MHMVSNDCFKMMHIFFSRSFYFLCGVSAIHQGFTYHNATSEATLDVVGGTVTSLRIVHLPSGKALLKRAQLFIASPSPVYRKTRNSTPCKDPVLVHEYAIPRVLPVSTFFSSAEMFICVLVAPLACVSFWYGKSQA